MSTETPTPIGGSGSVPPNRPAVYVTELDVMELFQRYGLAQLTPTSANELRFCQIVTQLERDLSYEKGLTRFLNKRIEELEQLLTPDPPPAPPAPPS